MKYLQLFHDKDGYTKAPQCYACTYIVCHSNKPSSAWFN